MDAWQARGVTINQPTVRRLIHHIRKERLINNLVASNTKGYYIENDRHKLEKYVKSLRDRAAKIQAIADSYDISGQITLDV